MIDQIEEGDSLSKWINDRFLRSCHLCCNFPLEFSIVFRSYFSLLWHSSQTSHGDIHSNLARITGALWAKRGERANRQTRRGEKKLYFFFSPRLALRAKCRVRLAWLRLIQICHVYLMHVWAHCNRKSRMPWYQRLWNQHTFICREFVGFLWPIPRVTCERIAGSNTNTMFTLVQDRFCTSMKIILERASTVHTA